MTAPGYMPTSLEALSSLGAALVAIVGGLALMERVRRRALARLLAWAFAIGSIAAMDLLADAEPAGLRMLALCAAGLLGMKGIVLAEHRIANDDSLSPGRWLGFCLTWPGMRPAPFAESRVEARNGTEELARRGAKQLVADAALIVIARLAWRRTESPWLATPPLLAGLSLAVHFGLFNLLAAAWRRFGVSVGPLFRSPLEATSLGSFWSRRWNLAFSEMTQLSVTRPLRPLVGEGWAVVAGFLLSGALHEMAISLPPRAGWGGPTLYFALHGALAWSEPALARRWTWLRRGGWGARAWVIGWLALPLPLLFHETFLAGVAWPLLGHS